MRVDCITEDEIIPQLPGKEDAEPLSKGGSEAVSVDDEPETIDMEIEEDTVRVVVVVGPTEEWWMGPTTVSTHTGR